MSAVLGDEVGFPLASTLLPTLAPTRVGGALRDALAGEGDTLAVSGAGSRLVELVSEGGVRLVAEDRAEPERLVAEGVARRDDHGRREVDLRASTCCKLK